MKSQIKVAVIDDGFRLSHESIDEFIFINVAENPFNPIDDDHNGYINDVTGWDISDSDNDVQPNADIIAQYYHGTFIASTICNIARKHIGEQAHQKIKIIPIKATSDFGDPNRLVDGYAGIEYAVTIGADIIITAWNGGNITAEQSKIIKRAQSFGALIIASAGNEATDRPTPPASMDGVMSVSAIDRSGQKMFYSNYGTHIDVCAFGESVTVASSSCDTCYMEGQHTSLAVAIVGGLAATIRATNPQLSNSEITSIIKNSAIPLLDLPQEHIGNLGAGMINIDGAIELAESNDYQQYHNPLLTEGVLYHNRNRESTRASWKINPRGQIHKTQFNIEHMTPYDQEVHLYVKQNNHLIEQWSREDFLSEMTVSGSDIEVMITSTSPNTDLRISYESIVLDSTNYHCREETIITAQKGRINDGSGNANYVNNTDCQWRLNGSKGSSIFIEFTEMDTEANTDYVYIFEGHNPLQTNLIAKFSGQNLPPKIHSQAHQVLIWFITDKHTNRQGWELLYESITLDH